MWVGKNNLCAGGMLSATIEYNGLRAGERNPVLRLRQGYGACTLLAAVLISAYMKIVRMELLMCRLFLVLMILLLCFHLK